MPVTCGVPMAAADGWRVATPEDVGLDAAVLCDIAERVDSFRANFHGLLVSRHGALVYEQYFSGDDQPLGQPIVRIDFNRDTRHDIRSVTKGITSLLVGIAIDRKLIAGVDEPVFSFFPEYAELRTPGKNLILLSHLLTMSAGLAWDEYRPYTDPMNSQIRMIYSRDPYRIAIEPPVVAPPGRFWDYNSGATELLGAVIAKTARRALDEFARETLFEPLGIADPEWGRLANDAPAAAAGLRLRPRDAAKLGQLVLNRGQWGGKQIVPAEWIDDSITPHIAPADRMYLFGYHWWLGRTMVNGREVMWVAGIGLGGQRIFIVPALDTVVVITAGLYTDSRQAWLPEYFLNRYVLAAVKM